MTPPTPPSPSPPPEHQSGFADPDGFTVSVELPCPRCGYSLRGCRIDQSCPECGKPVREAVPQGDKIQFFGAGADDSNSVFILDCLSSVIAAVLSASLVLCVLFRMVDREWELWLLSILVVSQAIGLAIAIGSGNRRKGGRFFVMLGDEELWYSMGHGGVGKMRFSEIRSIRRAHRVGLAVIVIRTIHQCDIPWNIRRFEVLADALNRRVAIRPISRFKWFASDLVYGFFLLSLYLLWVPSLHGLFMWGSREKIVNLAVYFAVMAFISGYISCAPVRAIEFKRVAANAWPWAVMFLVAAVRIAMIK